MPKKKNSGAVRREIGFEPTAQIEIIHLSDAHFGAWHQFNPMHSVTGDSLSPSGMVTLADKVLEDLKDQYFPESEEQRFGPSGRCPAILCITGDLAQTGSYEEFQQAKLFLDSLAQSRPFAGIRSVFLVPGNHDVIYSEPNVGKRWQQFINFFNDVYGRSIPNSQPNGCAEIIDRVDDLGAIIACINTSVYVQKGSPDEQRGQVDEAQLATLEDQLRKIPKKKRESAIRIALMHHHPVLIPALAEEHRGYDAVERSGQLLNLLQDYGFQLILHGHKHYPLSFSENIVVAFEQLERRPMMIVSGGSVGSSQLPPRGLNTYNRVTVKWHKEACQFRVKIVTRGLEIFHPKSNRKRISKRWKWLTLQEDDRSFSISSHMVNAKHSACRIVPFDGESRTKQEQARQSQYAVTRGNLPVVEVRPSLMPGQAYEATFWIVSHRPDTKSWEAPVEVTWSAGRRFRIKTVRACDDPRFCVTYNYWGPMLVQAELKFADGKTGLCHVYATIPE